MNRSIKLGILLLICLLFIMSMSGNIINIDQTDLEQRNNGSIISPISPVEEYKFASGEAWIAGGWKYRLQIEFIESESSGTNYPIKIIVNYDAAGDAYEINCSSNCQTDFDDIRFTDNDGSTVLSYWREEYTASDDATFWVEVTDSLSSTAETVIYIYWGNTGASYIGDATTVFIFYDGFESNNFNSWDAAGAAWSTQGTTVKYGSYAAKGNAQTTGRECIVNATTDITYSIMFHTWIYLEGTAGNEYPLIAYEGDDDGNTLVYVMYSPANEWSTNDGTQRDYEANTQGSGTWYRFEVGLDFEGGLFIPYLDSVVKTTQNLHASDGADLASVYRFAMDVMSSTGNYDQWQDDYYVRRYNYPEPTVSWALTGANSVEDTIPTRDVAPSVTNLDDTDNMYARYKKYTFATSFQDNFGYADIDYVELSVDNGGDIWRVRFDEDTNTFTEQLDAGDYIELDTGGSTHSHSGVDLDVTFYITIGWAHGDFTNLELKTYIIDYSSFTDTDLTTTLDYDFECELDYSTVPTVDDNVGVTIDRGSLDGTFFTSGTLIYEGSTDDNPPSTEVDVWVSMAQYGSSAGPWSDATLSSGAFNVTCYADNAVGIDTVTIKPVAEGAGSAGTTLYTTTDVTDTYISDRVDLFLGTNDNRINVGTNCTLWVMGYYEYDNGTFDGVRTLNQTDWNGPDTAGDYGFTVASLSGDTHGVSTIDSNDIEIIVWDSITVCLAVSDSRVNLGTNITLTYSLWYDYDNASYYAAGGDITFNQTDYNGPASAEDYGFTAASADGADTYGITTIKTNDIVIVVWDRVDVWMSIADSRVNLGTNITLLYSAFYEYDNASYITAGGHAVLNQTDYNGPAGAEDYGFTIDSLNGLDTYGITSIDNNPIVIVVWDRVDVWASISDTRMNVGTNITLLYTAFYEYDNASYITAGGHATWNQTDWNGPATAEDYGFTVSSLNGLDTYGITSLDNNPVLIAVWDSITIEITVIDSRVDLGTNISMTVSFTYDYDSADYRAAGGGFIMNQTDYNGPATAEDYGFTITSLDGADTYGVTTISDNDIEIVVWDQIEIYSDGCDYDNTFARINAGQNVTIWALARLVYDNHALGSGDYIMIDDKTMVWNGTYFVHGYTQSTVGLFVYTINTTLNYEATYGITVGTNNPVNLIFDRILIYDMWLNDTYIDLSGAVTIYVSLVSEYDNESMTAGVVQLNGTLGVEVLGDYNFTHGIGANWSRVETFISSANWTFIITWANWTIYNITTINYNGWNVTYLWTWVDRIVVMGYETDSTDDRDNINTSLNITVWLQYESDNTNVTDGTITINGQTFTYNAAIQNWTALNSSAVAILVTWDTVVSGGDNTRTISVVDQNGQSHEHVWDSLTITIVITDQRININTNLSMTVSAIYDYDSASYDGTFTLNDTLEAKTFAFKYGYTVTSANGDDTYGITAINVNDADYCIWDVLGVRIWMNGTARADYTNTIQIRAWIQYEYDTTNLTTGSVTLNSTYSMTYNITGMYWYYNHTPGIYAQYYYMITGVSGDTYGINEFKHYYCDGAVTFNDNVDNYWYPGLPMYEEPEINIYEIYVYIPIDQTGERQYSIFGYGTTAGQIGLSYYTSSSGDDFYIYCYFYGFGGAGPYRVSTFDGSNENCPYRYDGDNWYHIIVVLTPNWQMLYINGVEWDNNTQNVSFAPDNAFRIDWNYFTSYKGYFNITFMRVYDLNIGDVNIDTMINDLFFWRYTIYNAYLICNLENLGMHHTYWEDSVDSYDFTITAGEPDYNSSTSDIFGLAVFDKIDITVAVEGTWSPIDSYLNVSYTGIYLSDGATWDGYASIANTSLVWTDSLTYILATNASISNVTYYVYEIGGGTDPTFTSFETNIVWSVWDNITANVYYYVTKMTSTTNLFNVFMENVSFVYNGTVLPTGWILMSFANSTWKINTTTDGSGYTIPSLQVIPVSASDIGISFTNNATITIGSRNINFQWYHVDAVTAEDMSIQVENVNILDTSLIVSGSTNVGFTWSIYNEGVASGETAIVASTEDDFKIEFDKIVTYGLHNYSIYFDAGASGTRWFNSTYLVDFDINIEIPEQKGTVMEVKGISNIDCSWYIYNRDTSAWTSDTGSITGGDNYFQFTFAMLASSGLHNYSIYFNVSTTTYVWKNGTYYITGIVVSDTLYTFSTNYNFLSGTVSLDCNYTIYENTTIVGPTALSAGSFAINWPRSVTVGYYEWAVKFNDSLSTRWVNGSYQILPDIADELAITGMSYSDAGTNFTFFWNTNWWNTTGRFYIDNIAVGTAIDEGNTLSYEKPTAIGDYNISVYIDGGGTTIWVNHTYSVVDLGALYLVMFEIDVLNPENVTAIAISSWTNATVRIYENGVLKDTDTEGTLLLYAKAVSVGNYSISLEIDCGASTLWVNTTSYEVPFDIVVEIPEEKGTVIEVKGTSNVDCNWYVYNRDTSAWTGESGSITGGNNYFQFTFNMLTSSGLHNYSLYFNVSSTVYIWKNGTYYISGIVVSDTLYTFTDSYNYLSGYVSLDCIWTAYTNNTQLNTGSLTAGSFSIYWSRNATVGLYTWGVKFVESTTTRWVNGSFQVGEDLYDWAQVTIYNTQGTGFDGSSYIIWVNGTRYFDNRFYNRTDYVYNITITDYFNYSISSSTYSFARFIDIGITFYIFKVYSEMSSEFIYFNLTRTGGSQFSQHLGPGEIISYYLIAGTYTYEFTRVINGITEYSGTLTLACDTTYIITDISLEEIYDAAMRNVGGSDSDELMSAMKSMSVSMAYMQWILIGLCALIIGLMIFRGYTAEETKVGKDGNPVKKKKLPKQLEKYKFGNGAKNPKFGGIPKGTGQKSWSKAGATFKKDEE